jgi:hypothetical protein
VPDPYQETATRERIDLRVVAAFAAVTFLLVLPAIVNALTPADEQALEDTATSLEMGGREALEIVDLRSRLTPVLYAAELEDVAAQADDVRGQLEREPIEARSGGERDDLVTVASALADAVDDASLAVDDDAARAADRQRIARLVATLARLGSGG